MQRVPVPPGWLSVQQRQKSILISFQNLGDSRARPCFLALEDSWTGRWIGKDRQMNEMGTDLCENVQVSRCGGEAAYLRRRIGKLPVCSPGRADGAGRT